MAEAAIAFVQVKEQESCIASVCSLSALLAVLAYGTEVSPSARHAGGACANKHIPPRIAALFVLANSQAMAVEIQPSLPSSSLVGYIPLSC